MDEMNWQAAGVISNIILVFALVCVTIYYAWQTKKQTDLMEKNRRIERLHREMDDLISLLYSRCSDEFYFSNLPLIIGKDLPDYMEPKLFYTAHQFWRDVKKNLYLTPKTTRDGIRKFLEFKLGERDIGGSLDTYNDWRKKGSVPKLL